ncbi:MAG TPA: selenide, water dikinase SelD, partial [Cyclobacteriaceae bacterium]|nr:selenide, water dikinase SelD [Cyclobacteriaceae bacterium]
PGGTQRNWESYGHKVSAISEEQKAVLADPQTSGGLLVSVDANKKNEFEACAKGLGLELTPFGKLIPKSRNVITVA